MDSNEFYDYEGRAYINPTLSSGEQEAFINNLRDIQTQNNAQIAQQTYNLGTQVPSNLGGLGGGEAYFDARYQTPQVDEMVSTLKSAAQAQALNDVMSNYQAQLKQKYSQAQQNYNKRQRARQNAYYNSLLSGGGSGNNGGNSSTWDGDVKYNDSGDDTGFNPITWSKQKILEYYKKAAANGTLREPPKESDYYVTGDQATKTISDRTAIPEWLVNALKII